MPTVTEEGVVALAFCIDGRCPGYEQQEVQAVRRTNQWSYVELGGDLPGIERSTSQVFFANEADATCPHCAKPRLVEEQVRPEYPNTSGQDPLAIFNRQGAAAQMRDMLLDRAKADAETATLRAQLAEQASVMQRMASAIEELQSRPRGPGRPRKVDEGL